MLVVQARVREMLGYSRNAAGHTWFVLGVFLHSKGGGDSMYRYVRVWVDFNSLCM